jgi:hypothetical protein
VSEVNGRVPAVLEDFLGVTSFTVIRGDLAYRVFGTETRRRADSVPATGPRPRRLNHPDLDGHH